MASVRFSIVAISYFILLINSAFASDKKLIEVESIFELQSQKAFESESQDNKFLDTFTRNETYVNVNFTNNLRLKSNLVFERLNPEVANSTDSNYGNDRSFDGGGYFTQELKLVFDHNSFELFAGKFNPNYGTAFQRGRGIWYHELAQNYEQTEKLGFGASYAFNKTKELGEVTIGSSIFHNDYKILDGSTISNRSSRVARNNGTPGNNNDFGSFTISLDGEEPLTIENLKYHLSYLNLRTVNQVQNKDQTGFVTGLNYVYDLNDLISFDALVETSKFTNFSGKA